MSYNSLGNDKADELDTCCDYAGDGGDLTISCAQPESTMKSITQGTTASTFERTFQ